MDQDQLYQAQNNAYTTINYILNSMSILFSSIIAITIITLRFKEINLSDRNSLYLVMYIAIIEFFFSIFQMLKGDARRLPMWVSFISSWGYIFSTLAICFLSTSIVINTQLIITNKHKKLIRNKNYYLIIFFTLATILSLTPITFSELVFDQEQGYFWFSTFIWEWTTYNGWIAFSILYCTISTVMIHYNLVNSPSNTPEQLSIQSIQAKRFSKYVSRILLYSLIPILSYSPSIISNLVYLNTDNNNTFAIKLISSIFVSLQSTFTFIVFFIFDPIIDEVVSEHKRNIQHKENVLENIKKGVYVENIYNIDRELPSNNQKNSVRRNTIAAYNYARKRISSFAYAFGNERNTIKNNILSNLFDDDDSILRSL